MLPLQQPVCQKSVAIRCPASLKLLVTISIARFAVLMLPKRMVYMAVIVALSYAAGCTRTVKIKALAAEDETARRLQTIPGIGPLTALAVEAFAPPMENFRCGRDFAAWLGLVPRQFSSGGKERLGRISKAGQSDIRKLLIIGAMSRLNWLGRQSIPEGSWLARMVERKPRMLVAIALANKMARTIWAMLTRHEDYRVPTQAAAA